MLSPERFQFDSSFLAPFERSGGSSSNKAEVLKRLEEAVGQIQDSETFRQYLQVQARFHHYSFGNVALILFQRPDATHVAGYNTWLKLHRYVRKGEKGIKIIVPMRKKGSQDDPEDEDHLFFGTGTVFDISQTEGEPLPRVDVPVLEGGEGKELYSRLEQLAVSQGILVKWSTDDLPENAMGMYLPKKKEILIREAAPLQMTKTLCHELTHHFAFGDLEQTRGEHESIAESVAYVVCSHFGLDTGARSFPYVAVWSKDTNVLKQVLGTVQKISAKMIDEVEGNRTAE